jgi:hypothetical protein
VAEQVHRTKEQQLVYLVSEAIGALRTEGNQLQLERLRASFADGADVENVLKRLHDFCDGGTRAQADAVNAVELHLDQLDRHRAAAFVARFMPGGDAAERLTEPERNELVALAITGAPDTARASLIRGELLDRSHGRRPADEPDREPPDQRAFAASLQASYPDDYENATRQAGGWADPHRYHNRSDRRAAALQDLMGQNVWPRLSDEDKVVLARLTAERRPIVDLYTFASYRANQTVFWDPSNNHAVRSSPGESWAPLLDQGEPADRPDEAARARGRAERSGTIADDLRAERTPPRSPQVPPAPGGLGRAEPGDKLVWPPPGHGRASGSSRDSR